MRRSTSTRAAAAVGVAALAVAAGGIATAAIPNSDNGHIVACYPTSGANKGQLTVIDNRAGGTCPTGSKQLVWNNTGIRFRGAYAAGTSYSTNDVVTDSGSSYIALKAALGVPVSQVSTWALLASKGSNGSAGPTGPTFKGSFYDQDTWAATTQGSDWQTVSTQTFNLSKTGNVLAMYTAESYCRGVSWCSVRITIDGNEMAGGSGTGYAFDDPDTGSTYEGHAFNRYAASLAAGAHTVQVQAWLVGAATDGTAYFRLDDATLTLEQIG